MREIEIRLHNVEEVRDFVSIATSRSFPIHVFSGQHKVSAISFMEMFCLNLREPITAKFQCSDEEYDAFCADISRFLVK